jgi:hypothetical protein
LNFAILLNVFNVGYSLPFCRQSYQFSHKPQSVCFGFSELINHFLVKEVKNLSLTFRFATSTWKNDNKPRMALAVLGATAGVVDKNRIKPLSVFGAYRLVLRPVGALT